jgi:hypothetical protein
VTGFLPGPESGFPQIVNCVFERYPRYKGTGTNEFCFLLRAGALLAAKLCSFPIRRMKGKPDRDLKQRKVKLTNTLKKRRGFDQEGIEF